MNIFVNFPPSLSLARIDSRTVWFEFESFFFCKTIDNRGNNVFSIECVSDKSGSSSFFNISCVLRKLGVCIAMQYTPVVMGSYYCHDDSIYEKNDVKQSGWKIRIEFRFALPSFCLKSALAVYVYSWHKQW